MHHFTFLAGVVLIVVHEMDAVRCREWRIFPGLSILDEKLASTIFIFAHLPLFYLLFWQFGDFSTATNFRTGFDIFLILHLILHLLYLKHPKNEFKDWISWSIISGCAICGMLDLLLL